MLRLPLVPLAAASLALACGDPGTATGFSSAPPTMSAASETGAASTSTSTSTSGGSSAESGGGSGSSGSSSAGVFDMGTPPDFEGNPAGCQGKIDFLFVISSWYTESFQQAQLNEAFPAFVKIIKEDFEDFDYHIMVVDAGYTSGGLNKCQSCYMCINCGEGCEKWGGPKDYPCNEETTACDWIPGAGVTLPANFGASNKRCKLFGDNRYIIKGEPNLEEAFTCIATLGAGPKSPVAMWSLDAALQPEILSDTGCNSGFLRDEALLVVVVVQTLNEFVPPSTPVSLWASLLEKKNGNADAIVVMVISRDQDVPGHLCPGDMEPGNRLREFANLAKHGLYQSSCAPSYVPFLKEGADLILDQCALLIPQ